MHDPHDMSPVIGIDLGTTNSVVAMFHDGQLRVLEEQGDGLLPSVVGMAADGRLLVGEAARNQLAAFPERTIASVKRRMGEAVMLPMADKAYTPQEISAIILRTLKERAEQAAGGPISRAVITVPAFFDEQQRQATREAGELAGLTVERIINEPTAASLVYHAGSDERRQLIVYDLGGGTFDVSIVRIEQGVVEVLSSKGDTSLGGDDFDNLLARFVADRFLEEFGCDLMDQSSSRWRLLTACEQAKRELSTVAETRLAEEFIATVDDRQVSLDMLVTRSDYESLIADLVQRTIDCVDEAIRDAGLMLSQIDELILVGGSTRTPLVRERLASEFRREPRWSVNPDLAVALGAATQAAAIGGQQVGPVLVDVATHTLGVAAIEPDGELGFSPILRRNTPLPSRYEETFSTQHSSQEKAEISVYQGESPVLDENRLLGTFFLEGLHEADQCDGRIIVRFELSLDGTLEVTAVEAATGISQRLAIDDALSRLKEQDTEGAVRRLAELTGRVVDAEVESIDSVPVASGGKPKPASSHAVLLHRARQALPTLNEEDAADVERLIDQITEAETGGDAAALPELISELDELLFYAAG